MSVSNKKFALRSAPSAGELLVRDTSGLTGADTETDADLVRRARGGEQRAFSLLMARHKHWVYRFVRRYVGDADEGYDVVQDAFVAAMSNLHRYDPERPFVGRELDPVADAELDFAVGGNEPAGLGRWRLSPV